jgi:isopentenyl-diphosphate delta-isomerase
MSNNDAPQELIDVVDENDQVLGVATRELIYEHHARKRVVNVFVYNPFTQKFAFQQRGANVKWQPMHIGASACGHVQSGESYRLAAIRETKEEVGLQVNDTQLIQLGQPVAYDCPDMGQPFMLSNFLVESLQKDFKHDPYEVEQMFLLTLEELVDKTRPEPLNNLLKPALICLKEHAAVLK